MKKRLHTLGAKLKSRAGDSLAEVLIALLISALAIVMLANMIVVSTTMVNRSKDYFDTYYKANNVLSAHGGGDATGTVSLKNGENSVYLVGNTSDTAITYHVNTSAPDGTPVISYEVKNG